MTDKQTIKTEGQHTTAVAVAQLYFGGFIEENMGLMSPFNLLTRYFS